MDENSIQNQASPSTNRFIFADAFYNGLEESNIENNANDNEIKDELTPNIENNTIVPDNSFQEMNENNINNTNDFTQVVENNVTDINTNQDLTPNLDPTGINLDSSLSNMNFLLSGNNVPAEVTNENINVSVPENNTFNEVNNLPTNNINNEVDNNINNNVFEDEPLVENTVSETISEEPKEETDKEKFTHFLLGKDANYETINQDEKIVNVPKEDIISYNGPIDESLNVQTGIDKSLENFLFSRRTIAEQEQEDEFAPYRKNTEPEEKTVYRAERRKRENQSSKINQTLINNQFPNIPTDIDNNSDNIFETNNNPISVPSNEILNAKKEEENWEPSIKPQPIVITEEIDYNEPVNYDDEEVVISDLLDELREKSKETGKISILAKYGDDFCSHNYVTNPAIGREREIKELGLILLTPEKSAILVGKPGIGKTSIVEGLAYRIQRNRVPDALKGYRIVSVKTTSLLGTLPSGETRLQTLIDEIKDLDKIILFVDEVHMLMGATNESSLDFANMFKESLGRGTIKMIGATTSDEYERYVLRDKAFVRRFQRVDVAEPTKEQTVEILMGTLPKIEKNTGAKLKYTHYLQVEIMTFIVDITSEYKRVYGIGSRYPDICITLVSQAFSEAVFDNRNEVNILDIRNAIEHSKNIYPDVISKELINFDEKFKDLIKEEKE